MALSASQVWEVRTTGSDTNGGAFKAGASGTDYSVQDAAQVAVADAVANGTTTLTSATATFSAAHVGNVIYLTGGSGSLAATRREIVTFTNSTTVVLDAAVATGTGITLNIGGALLTLSELANSTRGMVASNKAFVKCGTYGITAGISFGQSVGPAAASPPTELIGYKTTRGDIAFGVNAASRPVIATNAASLTALTLSGGGLIARNLVISAGSNNPTTAISVGFASGVTVQNCAATAYTAYGIYHGAISGGTLECEVSGGVAATAGIVTGSAGVSCGACYVHDGAGVGIWSVGSGQVFENVVANMSGATADGIQGASTSPILFNTVYGCGRHGISYSALNYGPARVLGNILDSNGGYGLTNLAGAGVEARREWDGNAYRNNTSGSRNNFDDVATNPVHGVAPYANVRDVLPATLTTSPFTNAAGGDFTLNNSAGGGALLRGTGPYNGWPGMTQVGYLDFGAIQHRDAGGTTITTFIEG